MPMIQIIAQEARVSITRYSQGEDAPASLEWRSRELSATDLAHLREMGPPLQTTALS